jgi:hypothetical protein
VVQVIECLAPSSSPSTAKKMLIYPDFINNYYPFKEYIVHVKDLLKLLLNYQL